MNLPLLIPTYMCKTPKVVMLFTCIELMFCIDVQYLLEGGYFV